MTTQSRVLEPGSTPPPFTLSDAGGSRVSLADFAGKYVVLYFYPADDTPGCTKEACGFRDVWDELGKLGAVVLGVSADDADSHRKFADTYRLPFTLLTDPGYETMRAYGAYGEKVLYGRKTVGVIRSTVLVGPDGRVVRHWARVPSAAAHPAKVLAALREAV